MAVRNDERQHGMVFIGMEPRGRLMIFGRPSLKWDGAPPPEDYYKAFGFAEVHTLDVSDYEGATFVHDLNAADVPAELAGQYDFVMSGGTIEHVYNVLNAMKAGVDLLKVGGTFICGSPVNNWVDHGFWQISPTLKFDLFADNGFGFGTSFALLKVISKSFTRIVPLYPGESNALNFVPARVGHSLAVIKEQGSGFGRVPMQSAYLNRLMDRWRQWRFKPIEPFDIEGDVATSAPMRRFSIDSDKLKPRQGFHFYRFEDERFPPSAPKRPFRSRVLVYEDGHLLDWIVSGEEMMDRPGSFCHFGGRINFTARDGSDPRENGRHYEVGFSQPFDGVKPYVVSKDYPDRPPARSSAARAEA